MESHVFSLKQRNDVFYSTLCNLGKIMFVIVNIAFPFIFSDIHESWYLKQGFKQWNTT